MPSKSADAETMLTVIQEHSKKIISSLPMEARFRRRKRRKSVFRPAAHG